MRKLQSKQHSENKTKQNKTKENHHHHQNNALDLPQLKETYPATQRDVARTDNTEEKAAEVLAVPHAGRTSSRVLSGTGQQQNNVSKLAGKRQSPRGTCLVGGIRRAEGIRRVPRNSCLLVASWAQGS